MVVIADEAAWIWKIAEDRFAGAVQRADLYHVKQHLWAVAKQLYEEPEAQRAWVKKMRNLLRAGRVKTALAGLEETLKTAGEQAAGLEKELNYLKDNEGRMTYASGLKRGEPIGSGSMESTCRQYQARFKRTGQFWSRRGDEGLMCIDTFWRNQRWALLFPHTENVDPSKN